MAAVWWGAGRVGGAFGVRVVSLAACLQACLFIMLFVLCGGGAAEGTA